VQWWNCPGHGFFTRESADNPWPTDVLQELTESRQPKPSPKPKQEKPMNESGFDRAFRESERRRLREQGADDKLRLDADEKDQIRKSLDELLADENLTARQLESWARTVPGELQRAAETLTNEQFVQGLHGAPLSGRRRERSDMSNERFLEQLQGDDGCTIPGTNPYGGSY
jgi:hypothetical protein